MDLDIQKWVVINEGGQEFVYLYFYGTYKDIAMMNDVIQWPCKIGRTDQHPLVRIRQQLNASTPELPEVAVVFQCDNSRALENLIHNYMKLHNRFLVHSFNQEWFNTNPDEVETVVKSLMLSPDEILERSYKDMYDTSED